MTYYNIKIHLTKSFPYIGDTIEYNEASYKISADFLRYCTVYGVGVQSTFGTITIPVHQIDYIEAHKVEDTPMPPVTAVYMTF